jgi:excisionase family DNA binding protein
MTISLRPSIRKRKFEHLERGSLLPYAVAMDRIHVEIEKPWLSVADICEYMDVSTFVVTSVLRTGELPAVKFGREWRVSRDDFEEWINLQRGATPEVGVEGSRSTIPSREPSPDGPPQDSIL